MMAAFACAATNAETVKQSLIKNDSESNVFILILEDDGTTARRVQYA
jgi:hypothetical protein